MAPASAAASPGGTSQPVNPALSLPGDNGLRQRPDIRHDDGTSHGLRLDAGAAESLRHERGHERDIGREKGSRHVVAMADQPHLVFKPMAPDQSDQFLAIGCSGRIAGENDHRVVERALSVASAAASIDRGAPSAP